MDKQGLFGEVFQTHLVVRRGDSATPCRTAFAGEGSRKTMMRSRAAASIGVLVFLLAGCVSAPPKPEIGAVAGKLTGGLVGTRASAPTSVDPPSAGAAALLSGWEAGDVGRHLDEGDRRLAAETDFQALESGAAGVTREWSNAATGRRGQVTPGAAYSVNQYTCRDFVDVVTIDGRRETRRSTACRQPDGSWRPIS